MQIVEFIAANGHWSWIVAGMILLALELVVPGGFLLWMGISGIVTGLLVLLQPMGWPLQWLIFGALSLLSITLWVRWSRQRPSVSDRPLLNRRADHFIGHEAVLEQAIEQGLAALCWAIPSGGCRDPICPSAMPCVSWAVTGPSSLSSRSCKSMEGLH